jgi:hypothetical protein
MSRNATLDVLFGRVAELRRLRSAIQKRSSLLIWGPVDAGKTALLQKAVAELPRNVQKRCICWSGPATGRGLVSGLLLGLYGAGDPFLREKVRVDCASAATLARWLQNQSLVRLRGILFGAAERGEYWFFIDHFPRTSRGIAKVLKELINRCDTPIYFTGLSYSAAEIGFAWSLFWTDEYRLSLGPLPQSVAAQLLERCIRRFGLDSLDLEGFRDEILRLSGHLPGAIVKMCRLAADSRYRYGDQVKTKVLHVDYLMQMDPSNTWSANR